MTLEHTDDKVQSMTCQYFDTIAPSVSLNILKTGFLFQAAEASNHGLYVFQSDGSDEEKAVKCESKDSTKFEAKSDLVPRFNPRALTHLELRDSIDNLGPINDMKVDDLTNEGANQIYMACGRGA